MKKPASPVDPTHARAYALMAAVDFHGQRFAATEEEILQTAEFFLGFVVGGTKAAPRPPDVRLPVAPADTQRTYLGTADMLLSKAPTPALPVEIPPVLPPIPPTPRHVNALNPTHMKCTLCEPPQLVERGRTFEAHVAAHAREPIQP